MLSVKKQLYTHMYFNHFKNRNISQRCGVTDFNGFVERVKTDKGLLLLDKSELPVIAAYIDAEVTYCKTLDSTFNKDSNGNYTTFKGKSPKYIFIDIDPHKQYKLFIKGSSSSQEEKNKYKTFLNILRTNLFRNKIFKFIKFSASGFGLNCFIELGYNINDKQEFDLLQKHYFNYVKDILNKLIIGTSYEDKIEVDYDAQGAYRVCNINYEPTCLYRLDNTILNDKPDIEPVSALKSKVIKEVKDKQYNKDVKSSVLEDDKELLKLFIAELIKRGKRLNDTQRLSFASIVSNFESNILKDNILFDSYFKELLSIDITLSKHSTYESIANDFKSKISRYTSNSTINSIKRLAKEKFNINLKYSNYKTLNIQLKEGEYASDYINIIEKFILKYGSCQIVGAPGIGKSKMLRDLMFKYSDFNNVYLCPSTMLVKQFAKNDMNSKCQNGNTVEDSNQYASTFDSFNKISNIDFMFGLIDEQHIMEDAIDYRPNAINNIAYLKAKHKIFITATPNGCQFYGHRILIKKEKVIKQPVRIISTNSISNVITNLVKELSECKFMWFDTSKENLNKWAEMFYGAHILNSDFKDSDLFKEICDKEMIPSDVNYLFCTKLMEMGINILNLDFKYIVINNIEGNFNLNDIEQMVARFRKINIEVIIIKAPGINKEYKIQPIYKMYKDKKQQCKELLEKLNSKYVLDNSLCQEDKDENPDSFSLKQFLNISSKIDKYLSINVAKIKKYVFEKYSNLVLSSEEHTTNYFSNFDIEYIDEIIEDEDKIKIKASETLYKRNKAFFIENLTRLTNFKLNNKGRVKRIFNNKEDEIFFYQNINKKLSEAADNYIRYRYFNIPADKCLRAQDVKRFISTANKDNKIRLNETSCIIKLEEKDAADLILSKLTNSEYTIEELIRICEPLKNQILLPFVNTEKQLPYFLKSILKFDKKRDTKGDKKVKYSNFETLFIYKEMNFIDIKKVETIVEEKQINNNMQEEIKEEVKLTALEEMITKEQLYEMDEELPVHHRYNNYKKEVNKKTIGVELPF